MSKSEDPQTRLTDDEKEAAEIISRQPFVPDSDPFDLFMGEMADRSEDLIVEFGTDLQHHVGLFLKDHSHLDPVDWPEAYETWRSQREAEEKNATARLMGSSTGSTGPRPVEEIAGEALESGEFTEQSAEAYEMVFGGIEDLKHG